MSFFIGLALAAEDEGRDARGLTFSSASGAAVSQTSWVFPAMRALLLDCTRSGGCLVRPSIASRMVGLRRHVQTKVANQANCAAWCGLHIFPDQDDQTRKESNPRLRQEAERSNRKADLGLLGSVMALNFNRVAPASEELEIWSATERDFSFVISNESRNGPGLHGQPGFVASWRPINFNRPAIRVGGSPFKTFAEAEKACETMLAHLAR